MKQEEIALSGLRAVTEEARTELIELNEDLKETGVYLSEQGIRDLLLGRQDALVRRGRIQWSLMATCRLLSLASESPYISKDNLASAVDAIYEVVLNIQNETSDFIEEGDLIRAVMLYHDHFCAGDLDLLRGSATDRMIKNYRIGRDLEIGYDDVVGIIDTFEDVESSAETGREDEIEKSQVLTEDASILRRHSFVIRPVPEAGVARDGSLITLRDKTGRNQELLSIFREELIRYVGQDTTSASEQTAAKIFRSVAYTVQLAPKGSGDIRTAFYLGQQKLKALYEEAFAACEDILAMEPVIPLDTFYGTLYREVPKFFQNYDPQFAAHECPCLLDYPTAVEVDEEPGIQFMHTYLKRLRTEVRIINRVPVQLRVSLLEAYERKYDMTVGSFPLNFFEILMQQAFSAAFAMTAEGTDIGELWSFDDDVNPLTYASPWLQPKEAYETCLSALLAQSFSERKESIDRNVRFVTASIAPLSLEDAEYVGEVAKRWATVFESALLNECPENTILFAPTSAMPSSQTPQYLTEGEPMSDEKYAELLEALACADSTEKQSSIIRSRVRSGKDLIDLLREDFWLPGEKDAFLMTLLPEEKTLLMSLDDDIEPILGKS